MPLSASLTSIGLGHNIIGSEGAKHIAKGISASASLVEVITFSQLSFSLALAHSTCLIVAQIDLSENELCGLDEDGEELECIYDAERIEAIALAISTSASLTKVFAFLPCHCLSCSTLTAYT